ncbi:MAG TPA: hypothetical protein VMU22_00020 [Rhizomicrobium sp.]|nr:hypothetical protein [Rhizomicrobium sp.]
MTHAFCLRAGAAMSVLCCVLMATPVFAQTGGRGGTVNGGDSLSPSGVGSPTGTPIITGPAEPQDESLAPAVANPPGTYGGMGPAPQESQPLQPGQKLDQACKDMSSNCPQVPPH